MPLPPEAPEKPTFPWATWGPWEAIGATVLALIIGILLSFPVYILSGSFDPDQLGLSTKVAAQLCAGAAFLLVPFGLSYLSGGGSFKVVLRRLGFRSFRPGNALKWSAIGIFSYFAFAAVYSAIFGTPEQDDIAGDFGPIGLQILLIVIVAPVTEEVCFRGMLFGGIRNRLPLWAAALAAGAVFGLLHYSTGPSAVVPLIALGAIFAVVYEKTGSVWATILMHAFNNGLALLFLNLT
ncbi:MAG: type II CAAX endopeptidase family protein [Solirubrobacterales bacterium]